MAVHGIVVCPRETDSVGCLQTAKAFGSRHLSAGQSASVGAGLDGRAGWRPDLLWPQSRRVSRSESWTTGVTSEAVKRVILRHQSQPIRTSQTALLSSLIDAPFQPSVVVIINTISSRSNSSRRAHCDRLTERQAFNETCTILCTTSNLWLYP